ncbi:hypothetical protein FIBSPDRAFT_887988 [Athelia psychrophila]|uniref:Uncharacterized protein n=1 Tax=Athelia psychrophila TaxID=1759441 RepID=A0A166NX55_9AGAM|nr:hypothetical protein FIBSPDRAFT_887988 [Fibularhizoctonia sp. CBS 109695]
MSRRHGSSSSQAYGDENYRQFSPPRTPAIHPHPNQYYEYPPTQSQPHFYGSGVEWVNQLNPLAYSGSPSQSGNHYFNPNQFSFPPPATQQNHHLPTAATTNPALTNRTLTVLTATQPLSCTHPL